MFGPVGDSQGALSYFLTAPKAKKKFTRMFSGPPVLVLPSDSLCAMKNLLIIAHCLFTYYFYAPQFKTIWYINSITAAKVRVYWISVTCTDNVISKPFPYFRYPFPPYSKFKF